MDEVVNPADPASSGKRLRSSLGDGNRRTRPPKLALCAPRSSAAFLDTTAAVG